VDLFLGFGQIVVCIGPSLTAFRPYHRDVMSRFLDLLLGKDEPARKRRRAQEIPVDRGVSEVQELKETLRHYAREAARSAAARDGIREVEELKRALREHAAVLAERERDLDERERDLDERERELRSSRRGRRKPSEGGSRRSLTKRSLTKRLSQDSES